MNQKICIRNCGSTFKNKIKVFGPGDVPYTVSEKQAVAVPNMYSTKIQSGN
jgi:hypothetical protein